MDGLSVYCGTSWFRLPDGWWGACCAAHDASGLTLQSNLDFARCLFGEGGPILAAIGFAFVMAGWLIKRLGLWPGDTRNAQPASAGFFMEGSMMEFRGAALPLHPNDLEVVAGYLGCEVAVLRAVIQIESAGNGFQDGRPIILNEPHVFYRELGRGSKRDRAVSSGLAYRRWRTKPYPRTQEARYDWLEKAIAIDPAAALRSCSYGLPQMMGFNAETCGFKDVFEFFEAMKHSEGAQVYAMARFIVSKRLQRHMRNKAWASFARGYNGAGYAKNGYHTKMARAYENRPASEKRVPPVPSDDAINALLGRSTPQAPQRPAQPDIAPPPPDIPKPDENPSQPPQGGFFVWLKRLLDLLLKGLRS